MKIKSLNEKLKKVLKESETVTFEIYVDDLTEEAHKRFKELTGLDISEMNYNVFPIAFVDIDLDNMLNEDYVELIDELDGSEIEAIFRKHCKRKPEYRQVKELLADDYEANYEYAEQIMIDSIKKYIPIKKLANIVDEVDY